MAVPTADSSSQQGLQIQRNLMYIKDIKLYKFSNLKGREGWRQFLQSFFCFSCFSPWISLTFVNNYTIYTRHSVLIDSVSREHEYFITTLM